jgi:hypothetical protein
MTNGFEVWLALGEFARVDNTTLGEHKELIEKRNNVAARLVNCENHGPFIFSGKGDKGLDDVESVVCIKACGIRIMRS